MLSGHQDAAPRRRLDAGQGLLGRKADADQQGAVGHGGGRHVADDAPRRVGSDAREGARPRRGQHPTVLLAHRPADQLAVGQAHDQRAVAVGDAEGSARWQRAGGEPAGEPVEIEAEPDRAPPAARSRRRAAGGSAARRRRADG